MTRLFRKLILKLHTREIINFWRYIFENLVPPVIRDSRIFYYFCNILLGDIAIKTMTFKHRAALLASADLKKYYENYESALDSTDLNQISIQQIQNDVVGDKILDVGCGRGGLLATLAQNKSLTLYGCDIVIDHSFQQSHSDRINLFTCPPEGIPYPDHYFDTVICTHVLEHVLDFDASVRELRRVAKQRLIIVVPKEREYKYALNPHIHFFPYTFSLINRLRPSIKHYCVKEMQGDLYYRENISP